MKIALINPPFLFISATKLGVSQCLGLRTISAYLKTLGHDVVFIDGLRLGFKNRKQYAQGVVVGLEYEDIVKRIPLDVDFIGISVPFSQVSPIAHDIIALARKRLPKAVIIMGGVYPSTQPELALTSKADYIVVGDGEEALAKLMSGTAPSEIPGLYSCTGDRGRKCYPSAPWWLDLDQLPYPDFDIPVIETYFDVSPRARKGTRTAALVTSRGCPYECTFCSVHPTAGYKFRRRSPQHVLGEIELLSSKYGVVSIEIEDDNFTLRRDRTIEILEGIVRMNEKGANLTWRTPNGVRIDSLNDEVMALITRSGCSELTLALEHGDQEMVAKVMNKKLDLETAFGVFQLAAKYDVMVNIFVIVGYPGETTERFENSLAYLRRVKNLGVRANCLAFLAQPYPGTELLKECREEGYLRPPPGVSYADFDNFLIRRDLMSTGNVVSIETPDFDESEVRRRQAVVQAIFK